MKILYINGYKGSCKKAKILSEFLGPVDCDIIDYDNFDFEKVYEKAKNYDLIISSSTGSYLGRCISEKNNIPLISMNPVIDLEDTFRKLNANPPNPPNPPKIPKPNFDCIEELVLLNKNDELIDYKKTIERLKNQSEIIVYDKGTHRFENIKDVKDDILNFIKFLYIS